MSADVLRLDEAMAWLPGAQLSGVPGTVCHRVCTDSRAVQPGDLFVALQGERFDAHAFLSDVMEKGAAAVLVSQLPTDFVLPALKVADTRLALGQVARGWRTRFTLPVVAVTGSNGKTTVKEMIAAIFAADQALQGNSSTAYLATSGNLNNDIGLPLTVLRLQSSHRLAVLELGMNHPGETAYLADIAQPTVALINNAQREHQEFMVNTEAVAREHSAVIAALPTNGVAVIPADAENGSEYAPLWRAVAGARRVIDFGLSPQAAVSATWQAQADGLYVQLSTPAGELSLRLQVLGIHNIRNALAACAAALAAGVSLQAIRQGLETFTPVKGRLQLHRTAAGNTVIDDSYNANPDSMRAAIEVLSVFPSPRILVAGDMGEVGEQGPKFHHEIGGYARQCGVDACLLAGPLMQEAALAYGEGAQHYASVEELIAALLAQAPSSGASFLVKGSRFMRMERVVAALQAALPQTEKDEARC